MWDNIFLRFVVMMGSVAAYLGLAILGWGGWDAYFANPARTALVIAMLAATVMAVFAGGNISSGVREDRRNRWVLWAFSINGFLSAWVPAYTDRLDFWTIGGETVRWIGVVLGAGGAVLRIWPVFVLGNRFSGLVAIQPGHRLVTGGIYRFVRHPSYLGLMISSLGWALVFRSLVGVLLTALMIPPLVARIRSEERLLRSEFGPEYDDYRAHTHLLLPWPRP